MSTLPPLEKFLQTPMESGPRAILTKVCRSAARNTAERLNGASASWS